MIYLLHPSLTGVSSPVAESFHTACDTELRRHVLVTPVGAKLQLASVEATPEDAVIFFNHEATVAYPAELLRVLRGGGKAFPVAVSKELRVPPSTASTSQSFDVHHELNQRGLEDSNVGTVAAVLARAVLAWAQPTLSQFKMRLFLSHRRADGEDLATWFYQQLKQRAEKGFQDLSDVFAGEDAQSVIETRLAQSDAVIFLDTPLAYKSAWVSKELEMALSLNLPIVWVSAGGEEGGKLLQVRPAAVPHFKVDANARDAGIVDKAVNQAFSLARERGIRILDTARRLKELSRKEGIEFIEKSQNKLVYTLRIPRRQFRYPEPAMKHVIQFFGRWPKHEDEEEFARRLPQVDAFADLGLLLASIPPQLSVGKSKEADHRRPVVVVDSGEEYVSTLESYLRQPIPQNKRGLVISGAFPEGSEPSHQQDLIDAVHAFARAVFDRGGLVIFGTHPTFVPLIFDMAKRRRPRDFRNAVHLYYSTFFRVQAKEMEDNAVVRPIEGVANNRNESLSLMRQAMVQDPEAAGLVALGGKFPREGIPSGVDEEIARARAAGLPVFLVGSVQGRSSQVAAEHSELRWTDKLNNLSNEENEQLRLSLDFGSSADLVLNSLGI
jgi:SLOG cluster3 family/TIR domain